MKEWKNFKNSGIYLRGHVVRWTVDNKINIGIGCVGHHHTVDSDGKINGTGYSVLNNSSLGYTYVNDCDLEYLDEGNEWSGPPIGKIDWKLFKIKYANWIPTDFEDKMDSEIITRCLLCHFGKLEEIISFGNTPLANELMTESEVSNISSEKHQKFDLTLMHCLDCGHCQLKTAVNEDRLYKNYLYVSGTNANNVLHFKKYAEKIINKFYPDMYTMYFMGKEIEDLDLIIEIASNDGTFLKFFNGNIRKIGVDPAENLVAEAAKNGVTNIPVFFNEATAANEISKACNGKKAKVIVANNVFAHNKDIIGILMGVKELLSDDGTFIFENSYLLDVLDKQLFDLFYHEHIHEHSITPLVKLFDSFRMKIYDVERLPNHGGSIRVFVCRKSNKNIKIEQSVYDLLELEKDIPTKLQTFKTNVESLKIKTVNMVKELKKSGKTIGILGLPAKATTLLYYFGLDKDISYIYDDNSLKQGLYAPGTNIKISPTNKILEEKPDVLIVLAWNFANDMIEKVEKMWSEKYKSFRYPTFIIPLPELIIKRYCENKYCSCNIGPVVEYKCQECGGLDYTGFNPFEPFNYNGIK